MEKTAVIKSPRSEEKKEVIIPNSSYSLDDNNKKKKKRKKKRKNHGGDGDFVVNLNNSMDTTECLEADYVENREDYDSLAGNSVENEKGSLFDGDRIGKKGKKRKKDVKVWSPVGFCGNKRVEEVGMGNGLKEEKNDTVTSDGGGSGSGSVVGRSKEGLENLFAEFCYKGGKNDRNINRTDFIVGNRRNSSVVGGNEAGVLPGFVAELKGDEKIEKDMGGISSKKRKRGEKDRNKGRKGVPVVSHYIVKRGDKGLVEKGEKHSDSGSQKLHSQAGISGILGADEAVHSCGICEESEGTKDIETEIASVLPKRRRSGERGGKNANKKVRVVSPYFVRSVEDEIGEKGEKHLSNRSRKSHPISKVSEIFGASKAACVLGVSETEELEESKEIEKEVSEVSSRNRRSGEKGQKNEIKEVRVVSPYFVNSGEEETVEKGQKYFSNRSQELQPKNKISDISAN